LIDTKTSIKPISWKERPFKKS